MDERIAAAKARARPPPRHPRPSLPARRGHQVRRLHRRLATSSLAAGGEAPGRRVHRLLRRPLHGRERRRACARRTSRSSCRTSPPAARWPTWPTPTSSRCAGASSSRWASSPARLGRRHARRDPGHLHQLVGGHQGVRRRTRRRRLHLVQRRGDADVGVGARREDPLPARPAPRPQHRLQDGRAARPDGGVGSRTRSGAVCSPRIVQNARIILWKGHCSVHTRFTVRQIEQLPRAASRGPGHRASRGAVGRRAGGRRRAARPSTSSTRCSNSPAGSIWAVGTEVHLVNRLAHEVAPDRTVVSLDQFGCLCSTMFRVSPNHLLWVLEGLVEGDGPQPDRRAGRQKHWSQARARPHARSQELGARS